MSESTVRGLVNLIAYTLLLSLNACSSFDEDYYEKTSGIRLSKEVKVVESYDNAEYLTITSIKSDRRILNALITKYDFEKAGQVFNPSFIGLAYLKEAKPDLTQNQNLYVKAGSKGKGSWIYLIDLHQSMLWAEIQYPDYGGN